MSADVVTIGGETLLEFVAREGVTNTSNVAGRFGWTLEIARRELRRLSRQGLIRERGLVRHPGASVGGSIIEWEIAA